MGWTWQHEDETWKNGRYSLDRKAICDRFITQEAEEIDGHWYPKREVLKSSMVGSVYYAAVRTRRKDGSSEVCAAVFLTKINSRDYFNFGYKDMDETCGPGESQCPTGILKLLTETDSEYAKMWRKRCWEHHEKKKEKRVISELPPGSKISFVNKVHLTDGRKPGDEIILTKKERRERGKRRQYWSDGHYRWPSTWIPDEYKIVA